MGFLSGLLGGGGGSINTDNAQIALQRAQWEQEYQKNRANAANAPYLDYGTGALDELSFMLGIQKPNRLAQNFASPEELAAEISRTARSGNPGQMSGRPLYYDPVLGRVSGVTSGDYIGLKTLEGSEDDYLRVANELWQKHTPQDRSGEEGYGELLRKFDMEQDYEQSPNYQFNLDEGEKALARAQAARGDFFDAEATKELQKYGSDLASQEFLNSYNIFQDQRDSTYNKLLGVADRGQQAVGTDVVVGQNFANQYGQLQNARAQLDLSAQAANAQRKQSAFGSLGRIAGAAIGGSFGGLEGARLGASIGGYL